MAQLRVVRNFLNDNILSSTKRLFVGGKPLSRIDELFALDFKRRCVLQLTMTKLPQPIGQRTKSRFARQSGLCFLFLFVRSVKLFNFIEVFGLIELSFELV